MSYKIVSKVYRCNAFNLAKILKARAPKFKITKIMTVMAPLGHLKRYIFLKISSQNFLLSLNSKDIAKSPERVRILLHFQTVPQNSLHTIFSTLDVLKCSKTLSFAFDIHLHTVFFLTGYFT